MTFSVVDVSHHQEPRLLDYLAMKEAGLDGVIVRATYGKMVDRQAREHITRARDAGLAIGVYHFFRGIEPVRDQVEVFYTAAHAAGYGRPGDFLPTLDAEDDTEKRPIGPEHAPMIEEAAELLTTHFRLAPYIYITQRDWGRLGKPAFVLELPLHVAHYAAPSVVEPATPNGMPWAIWQNRVGRFQVNGPHGFYKAEEPKLDHNRVRKILLLDGSEYEAFLEKDEQFPEQRKGPDIDGTHLHRAAMLESILRAEAQHYATESTNEILSDARAEAHREMLADDEENG
jgi:hypothetical protein